MTRPLLLLAAIPFALLGACSVQEDAAGNGDTATAENANMTPEGPGLAARLFGGGKPMPLDIQAQAANGAIVYLTSIQAKPTETVIGFKVVNGFERDIELNWSDKKTFLVSGGQKFFVSPPVGNEDIKVTAGSTMQGELVFLGRLPQTGAVTLVFNDGMSNGTYSSEPNISIPVPVTTAAFTDDGSKKNLAA